MRSGLELGMVFRINYFFIIVIFLSEVCFDYYQKVEALLKFLCKPKQFLGWLNRVSNFGSGLK